jgi:hypothetical protein
MGNGCWPGPLHHHGWRASRMRRQRGGGWATPAVARRRPSARAHPREPPAPGAAAPTLRAAPLAPPPHPSIPPAPSDQSKQITNFDAGLVRGRAVAVFKQGGSTQNINEPVSTNTTAPANGCRLTLQRAPKNAFFLDCRRMTARRPPAGRGRGGGAAAAIAAGGGACVPARAEAAPAARALGRARRSPGGPARPRAP